MSRINDELDQLDQAVVALEQAFQRRLKRLDGDMEAVRKAASNGATIPPEALDHAVLADRVDRAIRRLETVLENDED